MRRRLRADHPISFHYWTKLVLPGALLIALTELVTRHS